MWKKVKWEWCLNHYPVGTSTLITNGEGSTKPITKHVSNYGKEKSTKEGTSNVHTTKSHGIRKNNVGNYMESY